MRCRFKYLFYSCMTIFPLPLLAGIQNPLIHTYELALGHAPGMAIADARTEHDIAALTSARSVWLPSVKLESSMTRNLTNNSLSVYSNNEQVSMSVQQSVFNIATIHSIREKTRLVKQARLSHSHARQQIMLEAASGVFELLRARAGVKVAQKQLAALQNNYDRAELSFQLGASKLTDKLDARARLDLSTADFLEKQSELQQREFDYFLLTGQSSPDIALLDIRAKLPEHKNFDFEHWYQQAKHNNLLLKQSEIEIERQNLLIDQERTKQWPQLHATARSGYMPADQETDSSLSLSLEWPLYNSSSNSGLIAQARAQRNTASAQLRLQDQLVRQTIKSDLVSILTGRQKLAALDQAIRSSASALEATREGLRLGLRSTPDLLDAEQQYFTSQYSYISAQFDYLSALLRLKFNSGTLSESDLEETDKLFVP